MCRKKNLNLISHQPNHFCTNKYYMQQFHWGMTTRLASRSPHRRKRLSKLSYRHYFEKSTIHSKSNELIYCVKLLLIIELYNENERLFHILLHPSLVDSKCMLGYNFSFTITSGENFKETNSHLQPFLEAVYLPTHIMNRWRRPNEHWEGLLV